MSTRNTRETLDQNLPKANFCDESDPNVIDAKDTEAFRKIMEETSFPYDEIEFADN